MGFVNTIVLLLHQKLGGDLGTLFETIMQVGAQGDEGGVVCACSSGVQGEGRQPPGLAVCGEHAYKAGACELGGSLCARGRLRSSPPNHCALSHRPLLVNCPPPHSGRFRWVTLQQHHRSPRGPALAAAACMSQAAAAMGLLPQAALPPASTARCAGLQCSMYLFQSAVHSLFAACCNAPSVCFGLLCIMLAAGSVGPHCCCCRSAWLACSPTAGLPAPGCYRTVADSVSQQRRQLSSQAAPPGIAHLFSRHLVCLAGRLLVVSNNFVCAQSGGGRPNTPDAGQSSGQCEPRTARRRQHSAHSGFKLHAPAARCQSSAATFLRSLFPHFTCAGVQQA